MHRVHPRSTALALLLLLTVAPACKREAAAAADAGPAPPALGKIAVLLPESKTARYESQDWPILKRRLMSLGVTESDIIYQNANQDALMQRRQLEASLVNGATVVILDPVDSTAAGAMADICRLRGARVVAYDRLIRGSDAVSAYVSFDNEEVGRLQGRSLLGALQGKTMPQVVMINGSPTDNNALMFKAGAHAVLDGKVALAREYDTPDWSPDKAQAQMQQALTALQNRVDGVYAANDGTAGGAIAALKAAGVSPLPPVTGQDAELAAIQRVVAGEQYMTVYKAIRAEAEAAADLAAALLKKDDAAVLKLAPARVNNGKAEVPALLLTPVAVTRSNVMDTVIRDGFWTAAQVCAGAYTAACAAAGIK